jgi:hypothetical protein
MMWWPIVVVLGLIAAWFFSRSSTLFVVSVRDGRVLVVSGRIPGRLLQEFKDVLGGPPVRRAKIRAWSDVDGGHLSMSGLDEGTGQRLRNVFRLFPVAQLRSAPRIAQPSVGQLLGIAWLAWMFERSVDSVRR